MSCGSSFALNGARMTRARPIQTVTASSLVKLSAKNQLATATNRRSDPIDRSRASGAKVYLLSPLSCAWIILVWGDQKKCVFCALQFFALH